MGRSLAAGERGAVTAELAVGLVSVVLVLGLLLSTASAAVAQLRCQDAARQGARAAALGESDETVAVVARTVAGPGSRVTVHRDGEWVEVTVTAPTRWSVLPDSSASGTARGEP